MVRLPLEQWQRSQQQGLELVGRALVEVEPVVAEHRTCEHLAGRVALGSRSLGRRLDDLCRAARVLDEQRRGEVHLEQDVEPEGPGQLERALEQSPRGAPVLTPKGSPAARR